MRVLLLLAAMAAAPYCAALCAPGNGLAAMRGGEGDSRPRALAMARPARMPSFRHMQVERTQAPPSEARPSQSLWDAHTKALLATLIKTLMGSSMLMLSGGLSTATDVRWAWIPAALAVLCFALLSAYTYTLVGTCCSEVGAATYTELWAATVAAGSAWLPTTMCTAFSAICCQVYMIVLRDILAQFARSLVVAMPSLDSTALMRVISRREVHLALLGSLFLPLCLLHSLTALARVSWVGMAGVFYLTVFASYRCLAGAYGPGGDFATASGVDPSTRFGARFTGAKILSFVSLLHGCYQAHFDAPRVFVACSQLQNGMGRFRLLAYVAFLCAGMVGSTMLTAGYSTFGRFAKSVILENFAPDDKLALLARGAVFVSLATSYPLVFNGFASNMLSLGDYFTAAPADHPQADGCNGDMPAQARALSAYRRQGLKDALAVMLVAVNLVIALNLQDLGFLCAITGSVISGVIIFIFPPIFHMRVLSMRAVGRGKELARARGIQALSGDSAAGPGPSRDEAVWTGGELALWWSSCAIACLGTTLCVLGAAVNLNIL